MILNMMSSVDPEQILDIFLALNEHTRAATEHGFQGGFVKADIGLANGGGKTARIDTDGGGCGA